MAFGVLNHQTFVATLAGGVEEVVELVGTEGFEQLGAAEGFGEIECGESGAATVERFAQERDSIKVQDVENHGNNGNFSAEEKVWFGATEAFLEFDKGEGMTVVPSEDFGVEDGRAAKAESGMGDFWEGRGDAF